MTLRQDTERRIRDVDLVLVTSNEIDKMAESDNISLAWTSMDQLLEHLTKGIRRLVALGHTRIIIAADHGYLFGDELDSDMKLEPPGGRTDDLHRRVWVGVGAARSDTYLHAPLAQFGLSDGDLEIAVPWGFGAFKVQGGARAYFHGGMSLPELVVPAVTLTSTASSDASTPTGNDIDWKITTGARRLTTAFCSVSITGRRMGLFDVTPPLVRVELRVGRETVSRTVSAMYGFSAATGEVRMAFTASDAGDTSELRENTVTLELTRGDLAGQSVTAHLLDALTNRELARDEGLSVTPSLFSL
jgi:hypothetical protein